MTTRLERIIKGCKWVIGMVEMGKTDTDLFKRATKTLSELLKEEAAGTDEDELFEAAKKIFTSEDSKN